MSSARPTPDGATGPGHTPGGSPGVPARSRGALALVEANCTVCMLCARECPDWCIHIESHTETVPQPGRARDRRQPVLDRFAIDYGQCLYCGICVEVCPFDALHWAETHDYPGTGGVDGLGATSELVAEREDLMASVAAVPPPPPLDDGAEPPPERVGSRSRKVSGGTSGRPSTLFGRT
ncbi:4Fe-4S binding protein [Actinoalloteichus spitiensis]|uniref:4Fe-4S binding protein n=1 Tax=Actinoalloteichus spitiensis TaxID=252394 RepID=UPI001FDF9C3F|nr:4Fe-4S binding protein [Actinoalloteichus spitiensis]